MEEIDKKIQAFMAEVFSTHSIQTDEEEAIPRENAEKLLKELMGEYGEMDAWNDKEFDLCYREFDRDGGGTINKEEFEGFVRRFANL